MCEKASQALECIDPPLKVLEEEGHDEAHDRWIETGKALKAIDRNLYTEWVSWTGTFQSGYKCQVLWDYFPPKVSTRFSSFFYFFIFSFYSF